MEPGKSEFDQRIGEIVLGRYRIDAVIGAGGQGVVYRAQDNRTGQDVAIKVLLAHAERDPTSRERMAREAQALSALAGTAAVGIYDQGFTRDGRFLLVQELLLGNNLEEELGRMSAAGRQFLVRDLPFLFDPITSTLERAHALDIIHRDLKPENVFLEKRGSLMRVRMLDFGFAKFRNMKALTMEGFVAGSPSYIAPETWKQLPVTPSVDDYSLAAMIFRVLAGRPPFVEANLYEMVRLVSGGPRPSLHALRPDLPPGVDAWVKKALAVDATERYRGPTETFGALRRILGLPG